jgi:hypothetical protein
VHKRYGSSYPIRTSDRRPRGQYFSKPLTRIEEGVAPVRVAGDGTAIEGAYPENERLAGGFAVLELASREAALEWAARLAVCCRCPQEVWEFMYDPES